MDIGLRLFRDGTTTYPLSTIDLKTDINVTIAELPNITLMKLGVHR